MLFPLEESLETNLKNLSKDNTNVDTKSNINISEKNFDDTATIKNENSKEETNNNYDEFKINLHRNTKTLKFQLGKRKNKIGVLIKNNKTLKKIKQDSTILKKTPITDIKQYLRKHNLIKVGCNAPNDVLRKIYESAILAGDINNTNSDNLLHNFINNE